MSNESAPADFILIKIRNAPQIVSDIRSLFCSPLQAKIVLAFLDGDTVDQIAHRWPVNTVFIEQTLEQARQLEPSWQFTLDSLRAIYGDCLD